jgi:SPP1 gp7 family putative phage head morphogenesis protein
MAITATTLRLTKQLRRDLLAVTNDHDRKLTAAWVDAWDLVSTDLEAAINELAANAQGGLFSRATLLRSRRLQIVLQHIAQTLVGLSENAGQLIIDDLPGVVKAAGEAQEQIIASQLPKAERDNLAGWERVDTRQIDAIVKRSSEQITSQLWPLSAEADAVIRREIVRGVATGSNPRQTASRIMKGAEGGFNGGLSRALAIARTETLDAHRAAAAVSHQANEEVLGGWVWLTNLSSRTCPACLGMNGSEHPLTEPGPLGHQNCRCSRMPRTKTWAELGIEGMDEPGPVTPDTDEWFAAQDDKTQRGILGAARYDAWKRGDYPISTWAVRKDNPEWRASYQTSPLPKTR